MGFTALNRHRGGRARSGKKENKIARNSFSTKLRFESLEDRRLLSIGIGNFVWNDQNSNSIQDAGEPGVAGVAVELFSSSDGIIGNADDVSHGIAVTDANGYYAFSGMPDGLNYYEVFHAPAGYRFVTKDAGSNDSVDSDADSTGVTSLFTVPAGQTDNTRDAGMYGIGFGWAGKMDSSSSSTEYMSSNSVALGADGSVYATGYFRGTISFEIGYGGGFHNYTSGDSDDTYICKLTSAGNVVWVQDLGGSGSVDGVAISTAADGSVYTTGYFYGTVDFDPGAGTYNLTSLGNDDIFISKLDSAGNFVWARSMGSSNYDYPHSIALGADGSVYTTGYFSGTADFDPGAGSFILDGVSNSTFISKLDSSGNFVWAKAIGGSSEGFSIAVATDGSVYTTGGFSGTGDFDPGAGTYNLTSAGNYDIFISKLDSSGNFVWARGMGGSNYDYAKSIAVGADGSVYSMGGFSGTADFDPGAGIYNLTSAGGTDIFFSKLNSSGNFVWARHIGGNSAYSGTCIDVPADGNLYAIGYFSDTVDFDPGAGYYNLTSAGSNDVCISKLDSSGNFVWARSMGGASGDVGTSLAVGADGSIYCTGNFSDTGDYDPGGGVYKLYYGDSFIAGYVPIYPPSDMYLTNNTIAEGQIPGTVVGTLSTNPLNHSGAFSYALVPGAGDTDNASFYIDGSQIKSKVVFDYETKPSYTIRVRTDCSGMWLEKSFTINVQYMAGATIGDLVWNDLDADGIQDPGEPGLAGVVADLYMSTDSTIGNSDDVQMAQTISDSQGHYSFNGLLPGTKYYIIFRTPVGYTFTTKDAGSDDALDSDADSTGVTGMFTLSAGQTVITCDAGLVGSVPVFGWAGRWGDGNYDEGYAVAVASDGSVYTAGYIGGGDDFDLGPGTYNLTSAGNDDIYVAKYTSLGALLWAKRIGGSSLDEAYAIALTADGSVYIQGHFSGTVDFDPGPGAYNLTSSTFSDTFICKLSSSGDFLWAKTIGGESFGHYGNSIAVSADGGIYITGEFSSTVDFDPGPGTYNLTSAGSYDIFISKLDSSGNFVWARRMGGSGNDSGLSIAVAADGSVYTTGCFSGTVDFDPGAGTSNLSSAGGYDIFVSKLDSSGNFVWAKAIGGTGDDYGKSIAVGPDGSACVTGYFSGTADFDPGAGVCNLTSAGGKDIFISKLDSSGNFVWARKMGGSADDIGNSIVVAADGSVYTTGYFSGMVDFDPGDGTYTPAGADIFISRLDSSGNFIWARGINNGYPDFTGSIALAPDGSVYITGYFFNTEDFDPGTGVYNLTSAGYADCFVARFLPIYPPSEVYLNHSTIAEEQIPGTIVGVLSTTPPNQSGAYAYTLVSGAGDTDNASFYIDGNQIKSKVVFDYETKSSYTIRVRSACSGMMLEKSYTINVQDIAEATVGNLLWKDLNFNGIQDPGEPGMAGIVVDLYVSVDGTIGNSDDVLMAQTTTDSQGHYSFNRLSAGVSYYLSFQIPAGYAFAPANAGVDDAVDSDVTPGGTTALFTLTPGQIDNSCDAGIIGSQPGFGWAGRMGGSSSEYGKSIVVAPDGTIYTTGYFNGTVDFDPGPGIYYLTSAGLTDIYVARYSSAGALLWARSMGGTNYDYSYALAVSSDGSVCATGYFIGTADFDPGGGTYYLTSGRTESIFISKLDSSGNFVWARNMVNTGSENYLGAYDTGYSIAVANDGSVYTTGLFIDVVDFDPGAGIYNLTTSSGSADVFISKLDSAGNFVWARRMGGTSTDIGYSIAAAGDGSVYTTGSFLGTADFDPGAGTYNLVSAGSADIFVSKLDSSGNFVWARSIGGTSGDYGYSIALAADGSVYTTGIFQGTADFDPVGTYNLTSAGNYDIFVSKLDSSGNFVWARRMGGTSGDYGYSIAVAADGSVYTSGYFQGMADFDPGAGTYNLTSTGNYDIFISKLDSFGNFAWARKMGGTSGDYGYSIALAADGGIYATGYFQGTSDFDPGPGTFNLTSAGSTDIFIAKLLPDHAPTDIALSGNSVAENQPIGTVVGSFSSVDPDAGEAFTYTLVSGIGVDDNSAFTIDAGGHLLTAAIFDYEGKSSYGIRVRTTDYSGMWFEEAFTISVTKLPATRTWDGGSTVNNLWTTKENWVGDVAPLPGDNLVFPAGTTQMDNVNDYPSTTVFGSITVSGNGYHFRACDSASSSLQVQSGTQLVADKIVTGTLTIGAGAVVTISPIVATRTWDGGSTVNNFWTTKENWVGDVAPMPGDNLIFPAGAAQMVSFNDYPSGIVFGSITVSGSGYQFQNNYLSATSVQVQAGTQIEVDKIHTDTLTIGAGATVTIAPIAGGPLAAVSALTPLASSALQPTSLRTIAQSTTADTIAAPASADTTTVAAGPLADNTVLATPVSANSEVATMAVSSSGLSSDTNQITYQCTSALTPGPSPKGRGEDLLASGYSPDQATRKGDYDSGLNLGPALTPCPSPKGRGEFYWTALPKIGENRLENPLAEKQASNAKTSVFASLHDELPLRAGMMEKRAYAAASNGGQVDFAAWQTIGEQAGAEADFDVARHARAGKHAGQLEKAIDAVIAEDEDLFLLVQ
jgi:uncharacterized membrane protein YqhA